MADYGRYKKVDAATKAYQPIAGICSSTDRQGKDTMQEIINENYWQIKRDVTDLIASEIKRIKNDPELQYLEKE